MAKTKAAFVLKTVCFNHKKHTKGSYVGCMIQPLSKLKQQHRVSKHLYMKAS